ncbi:caspase family protein [Roseateles sp. P5_E7]
MLALLCGVVASLAACAGLPRIGSGGGTRVALVIGNSAYENAPALTNPAHDVADMCAALKRAGFKAMCHTDVRDRAEFEARVKDYVDQLGPDSAGVFYFSGHGVQVSGANYLVPTTAPTRKAGEEAQRPLYPVAELFNRLAQRPTRFQMVILDACRTELFKPGAGGRGVGAAPVAPASKSNLVRAIEATGSAGTGLAPITNAPRATFVLYATGSGRAAFDGDGRNGPLTKHVLRHMGSKGLLVQDFIGRVVQGVETETLSSYYERQTPYVYGSFGGRFCFAGCPGEPPPPQL